MKSSLFSEKQTIRRDSNFRENFDSIGSQLRNPRNIMRLELKISGKKTVNKNLL